MSLHRIAILGHRIPGPIFVAAAVLLVSCSLHLESRDMPAQLRRGYNNAFFHRHNDAFRTSAAIHYSHGKAHDVLQLTDIANSNNLDVETDRDFSSVLKGRMRMEPSMMLFGPHTGQGAWKLYLAIDWTHHHHEQTYDILSDADIPWSKKADVTCDAVDYYLARSDAARSPAPLDLTMRRAAVMMKPYFTYFRNKYPRTNNFFYVAHWWHPAIYEAQMIGGNDAEQDAVIAEVQRRLDQAMTERPERMLLSREMMPRYARMSPESANIFDNLHMLHGIAYDIMAYEGWSIDQKRAELYRVVDAMSEQPGDRELAKAFDVPHPDMDPRQYEPWMRTVEGSMSEIMIGMMAEMWPMMSPDGAEQPPEMIREQMKKKLTPGMQPEEFDGSLHDALMKLEPNMKMDAEGMKPGVTPKMASMMVEKWKSKRGPDVRPWPLDAEPSLSSIQSAGGR
jgi:hypothetical protein